MSYGTVCPPSQVVQQMIDEAVSTSSGKGNYERLREVFDTVNKEGIISIHNAGYSLDDDFAEIETVFQFIKENNIPRRGYCFYHQQDIERAMNSSIQNLHLAFHSMNNDKETALDVGKRIVELLKESGFSVNWNHNANTRIIIENFLWDKNYDVDDYGTDKAIRIIKTANV